MCGIAGIVSLGDGPPPARENLTAMASALRHRGPDEFGIYRDANAGLAHARLSIIDLEGGRQPLSNEAGTIWVSYNGEIYNFLELRRELSARYRFRTASDTEVLVNAYAAWGDDAFRRFNGQFAVALWDSERRRLILARDRFGVRPLYILEQPGRVTFASEIKAIFAADPSISRELDPAGLDQTFTFWSPLPPRTAFRGISELLPGYVRSYCDGQIEQRSFVRDRDSANGSGEFKGSLADAASALREALARAVQLRIERADVPVGSYLSGGIDSSLLAALGHRTKGSRFHTFSLRFSDPEFDETGYQRAMAAQLGSEHHELLVTPAEIGAIFPAVIEQTERPILRASPAPLYLLSRMVADAGFKVVLTGEGADELFAGYDIFREAQVRRFWARQPFSATRPQLLERLYPYLRRSPAAAREMAKAFFGRNLERWREPSFAHEPRWSSAAALKRLFSPDLRHACAGLDSVGEFLSTLPQSGSSLLARDQRIEIATFFSPYLLSSQGDRMLMGNSVEGRFPFLDPAVVELAESLPADYKLLGLHEKRVLKRAAVGLVPREILERKKQPYRAPDAVAFVGPNAPGWISEMLDPRVVRDAGVFHPPAIDALWRKCRNQVDVPFSNADNMALVGVLSTQLLHDRFIRRRPEPKTEIVLQTLVDRCGQPS